MKTIKEADYKIAETEFCDGCHSVSSVTGTCHGTDQ